MPTRIHLCSAYGSALLCLLASSALTLAFAADDTAQALALNCAACHSGHNLPHAVPDLRGLNARQLFTRLQDFKNDRVPATLMNRIAKAYSDDELAAIAAYLTRANHHAQP